MVSLYFHFFCLTADEVSVLSGMWIWVSLTWAVSGRGVQRGIEPTDHSQIRGSSSV